MVSDIRTFKTMEEAATAQLGDVQLAVSQATGDYLDMYECVLTLKEDDVVKGYQKVIVMFEPGTNIIRNMIFDNGYGRQFVRDEERKGVEVLKLKKIEPKME